MGKFVNEGDLGIPRGRHCFGGALATMLLIRYSRYLLFQSNLNQLPSEIMDYRHNTITIIDS